MPDPERIWLQPNPPDPEFGRTWCTDPIFKPGDREDDCPGDTEYVRADLVAEVWRPIATAPQDGTWIYLACAGSGDPAREGHYDRKWECWRGIGDPPTHWMPLIRAPRREDW